MSDTQNKGTFTPGERVRYVGKHWFHSDHEIGNTGTVTGVALDNVTVKWDHNGRERGVYPQNLERILKTVPNGWGWVAEGLSKHTETVAREFLNDDVTQPSHYDWIPGIECKDVVKHFPFMRGAAIKYLWRAGRKGDKAKHLQDLRKAVECITNEIKDLEATA